MPLGLTIATLMLDIGTEWMPSRAFSIVNRFHL
jgi:hypothetical protein